MAECGCPKINDADWDLQYHDWSGRHFYRVPIRMYFHRPAHLGEAVPRLLAGVAEKQLSLANDMILERDGLFAGELMVEVEPPDRPVAGVEQVGDMHLISKVHYGPRYKLGEQSWKLRNYLKLNHKQLKQVYFWFVTCAHCSGERGHKTVIFAESR